MKLVWSLIAVLFLVVLSGASDLNLKDYPSKFVVESSFRTDSLSCFMTVRDDKRAYIIEQVYPPAVAFAWKECNLFDAGSLLWGKLDSGHIEFVYKVEQKKGKQKIKSTRYRVTGTAQ